MLSCSRWRCGHGTSAEPGYRADHGRSSPIQHVGIDLRGFNIAVAQQFLHGTDVLAVLQQMRGKGMTQAVAVCVLMNASCLQRPFHVPAHGLRIQMKNFRWHDLRHTWAPWHVQSGTSLQELQELGGWSSFEMVLRLRIWRQTA